LGKKYIFFLLHSSRWEFSTEFYRDCGRSIGVVVFAAPSPASLLGMRLAARHSRALISRPGAWSCIRISRSAASVPHAPSHAPVRDPDGGPPRVPELYECCGNGCVNCIWEVYRREEAEWLERKAATSGKPATSEPAPPAGGPKPQQLVEKNMDAFAALEAKLSSSRSS
jgi:Oxidoreductase-like protein, N-terminal